MGKLCNIFNGPKEAVQAETQCQSNNEITDADGDTCEDVYDDYPEYCGEYDTNEFNANEACCSCGGGDS